MRRASTTQCALARGGGANSMPSGSDVALRAISPIIGRMLPAYASIGVGYWIGRATQWDWLRFLSGIVMYGLIPLVVVRNALALDAGEALGNFFLWSFSAP